MRYLAIILAIIASPSLALELSLPGARLVKSDNTDAGSTRLPDAAWSPDVPVTATEGAIRRQVFERPNSTFTSLQLIEPIRAQLRDQGYEQIFTCADAECGGFDFRFQLDLIGEPFMHVDLGNYRYALMQKTGAEPHTVAVVASPARTTGFVHITEVSDAVFPDISDDPAPSTDAPLPETGDFADRLLAAGHVVLSDVVFETGSVDLGAGPFGSLEDLALWLRANPSARVVVVGHTDAVGSLDANTSLSRRRAQAVVGRLTQAFGTNPVQLEAAGAGYLAPIATNLTAEGRAANRRVEIVLLSLD